MTYLRTPLEHFSICILFWQRFCIMTFIQKTEPDSLKCIFKNTLIIFDISKTHSWGSRGRFKEKYENVFLKLNQNLTIALFQGK